MLRRAHKTDQSPPTPVPFEISRRALDAHTSVVDVEGDLDLATAPQLKWMLVDALDEGHSQLVLDLTRTTFMDSTALGVLVGVTRSLGADGTLAIVCANPTLAKIFELSGMDGVFAIYPTLDDALAHARGREAEAG
ncbi:MAG TPA: STAS domain-containing protein [Solirubrobacteraceae bacterium]|jgi:anti-sigma B factor antagonist|nr:STAS domain-containing protein [Solirubrobacteraceae bacterium]